MKFAWLSPCALVLGLTAGCSNTAPDQSSAVSGVSPSSAPEWALETSGTSTDSAPAGVQPIPEADDIVAADETQPAVKPIPDDGN